MVKARNKKRESGRCAISGRGQGPGMGSCRPRCHWGGELTGADNTCMFLDPLDCRNDKGEGGGRWTHKPGRGCDLSKRRWIHPGVDGDFGGELEGGL